MLTILVVGRNDYYGINLHKRTAMSLNAFAALCTDPDDEIIYVDCNTPCTELTLVEAISDTLTADARRLLRIFRISGEQMHAALGDTPLVFSDELARNVGLRRSNPRNPWVLSTNPDLLMLPLDCSSLTDLCRSLEPKFYLCPRTGVAAQDWQRLDRADPTNLLEFCRETVATGFAPPPRHPEEWLRYHSVGDFQLAPRDHWLAIGGCEEGMKLWGHSDANNARRLNLLNGGGRTPDLGDRLAVFHLDHTANSKSAHDGVLPANDWDQWITRVNSPLSRNPETWGLRDEALPEIRLDQFPSVQAIARQRLRPPSPGQLFRTRLAAMWWNRFGRVGNWLRRNLD